MPAAVRRRRGSRALAGTVAAAVLAAGGLGTARHGATPGTDTLVGIDSDHPQASARPGHDRREPRRAPRPVPPARPSSAVAAGATPAPTPSPPSGTAAVTQARPSPEGYRVAGIPAVALAAYEAAQERLADERPRCRLDWPLLAAIARVESDHGRYAGRALGADGRSAPPIRGIRLDGSRGTAVIRDSEAGALDGDDLFDRAVGPMQFIPTTWALVAVDGDGDGRRDPDDLHDAALAAGVYLCAGGEVASPGGRSAAVFRYNRSSDYVRSVLALADRYAGGVAVVSGDAVGPATSPPDRTPPDRTPPDSAAATPTATPTTAPLPEVPEDIGPASPTVVDPGPAGPAAPADPGPPAPTGEPAEPPAGPGLPAPTADDAAPDAQPAPDPSATPAPETPADCAVPTPRPSRTAGAPTPKPAGTAAATGSPTPSLGATPDRHGPASTSPTRTPAPTGTPAPTDPTDPTEPADVDDPGAPAGSPDCPRSPEAGAEPTDATTAGPPTNGPTAGPPTAGPAPEPERPPTAR